VIGELKGQVQGGASYALMTIGNSYPFDYIEVDNLQQTQPGAWSIYLNGPGDRMLLNNMQLVTASATTTYGVVTSLSSVQALNQLIIVGTKFPIHTGLTTAYISAVYVPSGSTVKEIVYDRVHYPAQPYAGGLLEEYGVGGAKVTISNSIIESGYSPFQFFHTSGTDEFSAVNTSFRNTDATNIRYVTNNSTGVLNVRTSGCDVDQSGGTGFVTSVGGASTLQIYSNDFTIDVTANDISTNAGQFANSSTTGSGKQGLAVSISGHWYALATGSGGVNTQIN